MAIKFGCCLNMVAGAPEFVGAEHIENAAKAGVEYVELPLAEMMCLRKPRHDEIRAILNANGLSYETSNNFFPKTIRLTGEDVNMPKVMEYVKQALGLAGSFGVSYVVFGSGGAKNVPDGFPMDKGYTQVVDLLTKVGPVAKDNGITITIEPLRKAECNLINTFEEGCKLAMDVNDPNVKVLIDYYHMSVEQESPEILLKYGKDFLRHTHFARHEGRVYPKDISEDAYRPFIDALKAIGYDGRVSCEAYSNNFYEDAVQAVKFFKDNF